MTDRDFAQALRNADRAWAEQPVPPRIERALRQRLHDETAASGDAARDEARKTGWGRWAAWGALATAAAAMVLWWSAGSEPELGGFAAAQTCPGFEAHTDAGELIVDRGQCELQQVEQGMALHVERGTRLRQTDHGVTVAQGHVVFDVQSRPQTRTVAVSGGVIEIVGTRFVVHEEGERGWVRLEHGAIRFIAPGRAPVMLKPGEELRWPLGTTVAANEEGAAHEKGMAANGSDPSAPEAATDDTDGAQEEPDQEQPDQDQPDQDQSSAPAADANAAADKERDPRASTQADAAPANSTASQPDKTASDQAKSEASSAPAVPAATGSAGAKLSERVAWLRARGRYEEAAKLLEQLEGVSKADRERLSYERGAMLTYRLQNKAAACAHWRAHQASFPKGTYDIEVKRAQARLKCGAP